MRDLNTIQLICIFVLPVLFAITVHEVAHGWVAKKLGDPTALMLGRLTLNPIKHIDPIGTIIVPTILLILGGIIFGWAKPVPITWQNLRKPRRDMALVALAGPMANLIMALFWGIIGKLGTFTVGFIGQSAASAIVYMGIAGIMINIFLMALNLIPIPPLDGSRIVASFLSGKAARAYANIEPYGFFILLLLLVTGTLTAFLGPLVVGLQNLLISLFI